MLDGSTGNGTDADELRKDVVFVAALVARSILDVVEAFVGESITGGPSPQVFFENRLCTPASQKGCFYASPTPKGLIPTHAAIAAGYYPAADGAVVTADVAESSAPCVAAKAGQAGEWMLDKMLEPAAKGVGLVALEPFTLLPESWPVLGFTVELQRLNEGSRKNVSAEAIWSVPTPWMRTALEASVGGTYVRGNSSNGYGPDAHLYLRWKKLYMFGAFDVGYRFYDGEGTSGSTPTVGGRIGFGTGLVWVYAGLSRDVSIESGAIRTDHAVFSLGTMITFSPSEARHFSEILGGPLLPRADSP